MIKRFRHKGLARFYETGFAKGINADHAKRLRLILGLLDAAREPKDASLPGLALHRLKGVRKGFWAVTVSGNWRVLFRFDGENVTDIDYLDYH